MKKNTKILLSALFAGVLAGGFLVNRAVNSKPPAPLDFQVTGPARPPGYDHEHTDKPGQTSADKDDWQARDAHAHHDAGRINKSETFPTTLENLKKYFPGMEEIPADWRNYKPKQTAVRPYPDMEAIVFDNREPQDQHDRTIIIGRNPRLQWGALTTVSAQDHRISTLTLPGIEIITIFSDFENTVVTRQSGPVQCSLCDPRTDSRKTAHTP
ncbi:hypothetical protein OH491_24220 [Termitidicoccus mucosus]|uniref:Uncharacterized protein n=1 Tax=Termitidicoccus mucosus TaxID=1184151 RepID=A0A178IQJ1_9BACT|nr:hypothetical protein AW736_02235 [Opitutaceae bacterium TSB47]